MLKKSLKLKKDELVICLFVAVVAYLIGLVFLFCVTRFDESTDTVFRLGSIMAMLFVSIIAIGFGGSQLSYLFQIEVGFGVTRKNFFIYDVVSSLIWNVIIVGVVVILYFVDGLILKLAYSGYQEDRLPVSENLIWLYLATVILITLFREIIGVINLRFREKGFKFIGIGFLVIYVIPYSLANRLEENNAVKILVSQITGGVKNIDTWSYVLLVTVFAIAVMGISWLIIRKQEVTM